MTIQEAKDLLIGIRPYFFNYPQVIAFNGVAHKVYRAAYQNAVETILGAF